MLMKRGLIMRAYERLLNYVVIRTPSDEHSTTSPSSQCQRDTEEPVELLSTGFFKTRRDFIGSKTESCMEFDSDAAGEGK